MRVCDDLLLGGIVSMNIFIKLSERQTLPVAARNSLSSQEDFITSMMANTGKELMGCRLSSDSIAAL